VADASRELLIETKLMQSTRKEQDADAFFSTSAIFP
jgi:hypothetical protein